MPMNETEKRKDEMTWMRTEKPELIYEFLRRKMDKNNEFSWIIIPWIWLVGPKYRRLMIVARLANIGMTNTEEEKYWTWLTIRVKNS